MLDYILGGGDWNRTSNLLNANQVLSQLSYTPNKYPTQREIIDTLILS